MYLLILFLYFLVSPINEWLVHFMLHKTENKFHNEHHKVVYLNKYGKFNKFKNVELWPIFCIIICYKLNLLFGLLTFIRYWIAHTFIHFSRNNNNYLVNHHYIHHKYKKYNLCVSATWPDYLFNTKKFIKDS
jgi:hypothetical protein